MLGTADEAARNAFPALLSVGEGCAVAEGEEVVYVIGHADVAPEVVALAFEVMETVGDDLNEAWITQSAGALRVVAMFVELVGELAVVTGFGGVLTRRRMGSEEGFFLTLSLDPNSYPLSSSRQFALIRIDYEQNRFLRPRRPSLA